MIALLRGLIPSSGGAAGVPSIWASIATAIVLGGICFWCLREGLMILSIKKTEGAPSWIKAVGAVLVLLGLSSVLVAFTHAQ